MNEFTIDERGVIPLGSEGGVIVVTHSCGHQTRIEPGNSAEIFVGQGAVGPCAACRDVEPARPAFVTDEMLVFLDELRESGTTNMFGARPYLMEEFDLLTEKDAAACLGYWMKTFGEPTR